MLDLKCFTVSDIVAEAAVCSEECYVASRDGSSVSDGRLSCPGVGRGLHTTNCHYCATRGRMSREKCSPHVRQPGPCRRSSLAHSLLPPLSYNPALGVPFSHTSVWPLGWLPHQATMLVVSPGLKRWRLPQNRHRGGAQSDSQTLRLRRLLCLRTGHNRSSASHNPAKGQQYAALCTSRAAAPQLGLRRT